MVLYIYPHLKNVRYFKINKQITYVIVLYHLTYYPKENIM